MRWGNGEEKKEEQQVEEVQDFVARGEELPAGLSSESSRFLRLLLRRTDEADSCRSGRDSSWKTETSGSVEKRWSFGKEEERLQERRLEEVKKKKEERQNVFSQSDSGGARTLRLGNTRTTMSNQSE